MERTEEEGDGGGEGLAKETTNALAALTGQVTGLGTDLHVWAQVTKSSSAELVKALDTAHQLLAVVTARRGREEAELKTAQEEVYHAQASLAASQQDSDQLRKELLETLTKLHTVKTLEEPLNGSNLELSKEINKRAAYCQQMQLSLEAKEKEIAQYKKNSDELAEEVARWKGDLRSSDEAVSQLTHRIGSLRAQYQKEFEEQSTLNRSVAVANQTALKNLARKLDIAEKTVGETKLGMLPMTSAEVQEIRTKVVEEMKKARSSGKQEPLGRAFYEALDRVNEALKQAGTTEANAKRPREENNVQAPGTASLPPQIDKAARWGGPLSYSKGKRKREGTAGSSRTTADAGGFALPPSFGYHAPGKAAGFPTGVVICPRELLRRMVVIYRAYRGKNAPAPLVFNPGDLGWFPYKVFRDGTIVTGGFDAEALQKRAARDGLPFYSGEQWWPEGSNRLPVLFHPVDRKLVNTYESMGKLVAQKRTEGVSRDVQKATEVNRDLGKLSSSLKAALEAADK